MIGHASNLATTVPAPRVLRGKGRESAYRVVDGEQQKQCSLCLAWLTLDKFWRNGDTLQARCKTCLYPQLRANEIKRQARITAQREAGRA